MSCASSRTPNGTYPESQHRKPKTPKMIRSSPTGTRTQPDDDPLSQRKKLARDAGEFRWISD